MTQSASLTRACSPIAARAEPSLLKLNCAKGLRALSSELLSSNRSRMSLHARAPNWRRGRSATSALPLSSAKLLTQYALRVRLSIMRSTLARPPKLRSGPSGSLVRPQSSRWWLSAPRATLRLQQSSRLGFGAARARHRRLHSNQSDRSPSRRRPPLLKPKSCLQG